MNTADTLAAVALEQDAANKRFLAITQEALPIDCFVFHTNGHGPAPKRARVESVVLRRNQIEICVQNPKTGKSRWISLLEVIGREEKGHDPAERQSVGRRTAAERLRKTYADDAPMKVRKG